MALNDVSFSLTRGAVYGLIGENGSKKSTVSSIVAGMQHATKGEMVYQGAPWNPASMLFAQEHGIGMIVQEVARIENISVAENIFLGHEKMFSNSPFVSRTVMTEATQALFDELDITKFTAAQPTRELNM